MEKSFIIAGFGGQGVMVMGQLLSYTACETTDKYVTYFPSYGAEMRGGTANCYVVISDDPVGAPKVSKADYLVVLNDPSMAKFKDAVVPGGTIFVNSSVVTLEPDRDDVHVVKVDAGTIAYELGNPKVLNLVMSGAIIGYTEVLPAENVLQTAFKKLGAKRPELNPLNEKAFRRGWEIGHAAKQGLVESNKKYREALLPGIFFMFYHTCKFSVNATRYSSESGVLTAKARRSLAGFSLTSERDRHIDGIAMR